jgi:hypothetical protein
MRLDGTGEMFIGGGIWMPEKEQLAAIRAYIAEHPDRIESVLTDRTFAAVFGEFDRSNIQHTHLPPPKATKTTCRIPTLSNSKAMLSITPNAGNRRTTTRWNKS